MDEDDQAIGMFLHDMGGICEKVALLKDRMSNEEIVDAATSIIAASGFIGGVALERMKNDQKS